MGQLLWPADAKQRAAVCCHCAADAAAPDAGNERAGTGLRVRPAQLPAFPPSAGLGGYGFFAQNDRPGKAETPHVEVPRTRLRMLAMRCAGLQIYNSWMVPQYLAFLQAGGFAVQEHALLGDTLAPLCYARAVPDKTCVTQR